MPAAVREQMLRNLREREPDAGAREEGPSVPGPRMVATAQRGPAAGQIARVLRREIDGPAEVHVPIEILTDERLVHERAAAVRGDGRSRALGGAPELMRLRGGHALEGQGLLDDTLPVQPDEARVPERGGGHEHDGQDERRGPVPPD